jgi:predicted nucleic acid-binding protein
MAEIAKRRVGEMTILDSNTIIYLSKGLVNIDNVIFDEEEYAISVITYMEVLGYNFESEKEEKFIRDLFSLLKIKYLNSDIVQLVIALRKKQKIKLPDAIICATAIIEDACLLTNDVRLKTVKDLKIKDLGLFLKA